MSRERERKCKRHHKDAFDAARFFQPFIARDYFFHRRQTQLSLSLLSPPGDSIDLCNLYVGALSTFLFLSLFFLTQQRAMLSELISSRLGSQPLPRGVLHPLPENSNSQERSHSQRADAVPGRAITERVMGMQGHLDLQSQVLALQLTASSIIDRGKPIRTICSPQRSARAA